jgi:hypothetical protein
LGSGTRRAPKVRVVSLVFLALAVACALIGRILLLRAAFGVNIWWGLSIFLPLGPLIFRLSYPDLAPLSRKFRFAMLPCLLGYFVFHSGPISKSEYDRMFNRKPVPSAPADHYGMEKVPKAAPVPTLDERRAANAREIDRLTAWSESLRLKKRDLLHSDIPGNIAYNAEVAEYNAALTKAIADKDALFGAGK